MMAASHLSCRARIPCTGCQVQERQERVPIRGSRPRAASASTRTTLGKRDIDRIGKRVEKSLRNRIKSAKLSNSDEYRDNISQRKPSGQVDEELRAQVETVASAFDTLAESVVNELDSTHHCMESVRSEMRIHSTKVAGLDTTVSSLHKQVLQNASDISEIRSHVSTVLQGVEKISARVASALDRVADLDERQSSLDSQFTSMSAVLLTHQTQPQSAGISRKEPATIGQAPPAAVTEAILSNVNQQLAQERKCRVSENNALRNRFDKQLESFVNKLESRDKVFTSKLREADQAREKINQLLAARAGDVAAFASDRERAIVSSRRMDDVISSVDERIDTLQNKLQTEVLSLRERVAAAEVFGKGASDRAAALESLPSMLDSTRGHIEMLRDHIDDTGTRLTTHVGNIVDEMATVSHELQRIDRQSAKVSEVVSKSHESVLKRVAETRDHLLQQLAVIQSDVHHVQSQAESAITAATAPAATAPKLTHSVAATQSAEADVPTITSSSRYVEGDNATVSGVSVLASRAHPLVGQSGSMSHVNIESDRVYDGPTRRQQPQQHQQQQQQQQQRQQQQQTSSYTRALQHELKGNDARIGVYHNSNHLPHDAQTSDSSDDERADEKISAVHRMLQHLDFADSVSNDPLRPFAPMTTMMKKGNERNRMVRHDALFADVSDMDSCEGDGIGAKGSGDGDRRDDGIRPRFKSKSTHEAHVHGPMFCSGAESSLSASLSSQSSQSGSPIRQQRHQRSNARPISTLSNFDSVLDKLSREGAHHIHKLKTKSYELESAARTVASTARH